MSTANSQKLALYVRSLSDFTIYESIDGQYNHIGATVADAVLQANNKYEVNVKPRVLRILAAFPEQRTTNEILKVLESIQPTQFLNWNGVDRAERFHRILLLLANEGINNEEEFRSWLLQQTNLKKLRGIDGIGPKTVDYFKILVGISTSAIDRHLLNFLQLAGLVSLTYMSAQNIINEAADILSIDKAKFDHSIWQYMSKKNRKQEIRKCKYSLNQE